MRNVDTTLQALDIGIEEERQRQGRRGHLGYSRIGHPDERKLWLEFRWSLHGVRDPRILRIFDLGTIAEDLLAAWARQAGIELHTRDQNGEQFRFTRLGGHLSGSMDGAARGFPEIPGQWAVWEAKTANDNRFSELVKCQSIREWSPEYFGQLQGYMGESGMEHAMIFVLNKNDSQMYVEHVPFDRMEFEALISKAERIIEAPAPPKSSYSSENDWRAKLSMDDDDLDIYWTRRLPPAAHCRNCRFSEPDMHLQEASWRCQYHGTLIGGIDRQLRGCEKHQFIPELMPARMVGSDGVDWVEYESWEGGYRFKNGDSTAEDMFSSAELIELAKDEFQILGDPFAMEARREFGATIKQVEKINDGMKLMAHVVTEHQKILDMEKDGKKEYDDIWNDDVPF